MVHVHVRLWVAVAHPDRAVAYVFVPSLLSTTMPPFAVWCFLINTDYEPVGGVFRVKLSDDASYIYDLKEAIKTEMSPELDHLAAARLVVLRRAEPDRTATLRNLGPTEIKRQVQDAEELEAEKEVDTLQLEKSEELLVQMPGTSRSSLPRQK